VPEIRVDQKAGRLLHVIVPAFFDQLFAERCGPAALPDDRIIHRLAGRFVPYDRRFALVRHADCGNVARLHVFAPEHVRRGLLLGFQDVERVVLDISRAGVYLAEFILCAANDFSCKVEQNGSGTRRALIEGEKIF